MTMKRVDSGVEASAVPMLDMASLPNDLTTEESLQALSKLKPFIHVAKLQNQIVGYVTVERDGPVPGAAYMRNIVVKPELRRKGLGTLLLNHGVQVARDMYRKT